MSRNYETIYSFSFFFFHFYFYFFFVLHLTEAANRALLFFILSLQSTLHVFMEYAICNLINTTVFENVIHR